MAVPLFRGVQVVGVLGLYSSLNQMKASWNRTQWIIFIYLALDTLITVLFGAYLLSQRLVRPLDRLVGRVQALAEGHYQPAARPETDRTEIGRLEAAFEDMAGRLLDSRQRLEANLASLKQAQEGLIRPKKWPRSADASDWPMNWATPWERCWDSSNFAAPDLKTGEKADF
jgi:HAMP domain-containing protein